jgi:hypothetical protein
VLVLPAEAGDARGAGRFEHGHLEDGALHARGLAGADGGEGAIGDRLDVAVAEDV